MLDSWDLVKRGICSVILPMMSTNSSSTYSVVLFCKSNSTVLEMSLQMLNQVCSSVYWQTHTNNTCMRELHAVQSLTPSLAPVPVGAGADQTGWDGYGGWDGDVGLWSAAESDLTVGQPANNSQTPLLRFCWPRDRQHESPPHQHTGVMWWSTD